MATSCIQCGRRIGFFRKPLEGIYCSPACQEEDAATQDRAASTAPPTTEPPESSSDVPNPPSSVSAPPRDLSEPPVTGAAPRTVSSRPPGSPPSVPAMPSSPSAEHPAPARSDVALVAGGGTASGPCPKCHGVWTVEIGAGDLGRSRGTCRQCGFRTDFISVESCPNCRCASLVVLDVDEARCPRCKTRVRSQSQAG
jgi:hypothetical protein